MKGGQTPPLLVGTIDLEEMSMKKSTKDWAMKRKTRIRDKYTTVILDVRALKQSSRFYIILYIQFAVKGTLFLCSIPLCVHVCTSVYPYKYSNLEINIKCNRILRSWTTLF